ncbi:MAG TPA: prepilin-type N-terminal cleavage/methylation domain-containing protein [Thauera sp.]|uniref:prepilin-type N-terminal cleavage/methylation domain-containing protein n=1 Tax=Thauera sp. TaxID=1905334 RepID=UPI002B88F525|nr:prepilin-type N-terminal cleavage/methylation domain-containing protein [Thauera sp.]HRP25579.1 prepilin-type N-terminal cleavage/methylation domain-containing protein [Thauera sp.]HRP66686.1 prepilin-type N-terminal cleavage/methylation domain-containing protein [Thauera sp.]
MKNAQSGFTLVEIAVVLLIVGLLLGGVMKGQELIDSAKVKNLAQDFRSIPAMVHAYQDKFRALPGDDRNARLHLCSGGAQCTTAGNGNGLIDGGWDDEQGSESVRFWQHLRLANLASGSTDPDDAAFLPRNAVGGRLGVQRGGSVLQVPGSLVVCSGAIPGKLVRQLDIALDDGNPATGSLRAGTLGGNGLVAVSAGNPLDEAASHTVCASL